MQIWKPRHALLSVIFISIVAMCLARPADSPYKLDLPVFSEPQEFGALVPEESPKPSARADGDTRPGFVSRFLNERVQAATGAVSQQLSSFANGFASNSFGLVKGGPFSDPPRKLEAAIFEPNVAPVEKVPSITSNLQNIVAGIIQPKPVVDSIQEYEKYGNTGDKFSGAAKVVVGGYEAFSNVINTVLDAPFNAVKQIARTASEKLNNLGGRIIGI